MFNKKQNQKIERLENRIRDLEKQLEYCDLPTNNLNINWWLGVKTETLNARDIIHRFNELYAHLRIERKIEPAIPEIVKLTKSKKD